jgi:hypothetical protein
MRPDLIAVAHPSDHMICFDSGTSYKADAGIDPNPSPRMGAAGHLSHPTGAPTSRDRNHLISVWKETFTTSNLCRLAHWTAVPTCRKALSTARFTSMTNISLFEFVAKP